MKRKSDYVNRVELLVALDYLFKFTDEKHPATCPLICKHATKFGITYDPKQKVGNEINRHRISRTLSFLYDYTKSHRDILPFQIQMTDSGKYYASNRNDLSLLEAMTLIESVKSNKTLSSNEKDILEEKIKRIALNEYEKDGFLIRGDATVSYRKYSKEYLIKLKLLKTALRENKLISIRKRRHVYIEKENKSGEVINDVWHRVYKLKEYQNKTYAILVSVDGEILSLPIERIELPSLSPREVLIDEFDEKVDINDRFNNPFYENIEEMLKENKMLIDEAFHAVTCIFVFDMKHINSIKESFEDYFSIQFDYVERTLNEIKTEYPKALLDEYNDKDNLGYFKMKINNHAFLQWVRNNYDVAKKITIIQPIRINQLLEHWFLNLYNKYSKYNRG